MKNTIFFLVSTLLILILNLIPLYTLANRSANGRTYSLIHNNVQDYYFYQSLMNQGKNGHWIIYDPYTNKPHKSSIIFSYFTWAGKLSGLFKIPHAYTYHSLRIIISILFFFAAFRFLHILSLPYPNLIYIFFLFASPLFNGKTPFMYWWTGMDPLRRAAYLPHHMAGGLLLIISIYLIIRFYYSKNLKLLIIAVLLSPLLAFLHTPSLMILLLILPPSVLIHLALNFQNTKIKIPIAKYLLLFLYWIIALLSLSFMVSQTNKGFPWDQYLLWERNLQYPLTKDITGALGILFPFAIFGLIISILSRKFDRIFVSCWFAVPLLFIPVAGKFGLSNIRLIQGVPYFSLAVLSVIGIEVLLKLLPKIKLSKNILIYIISVLFLIQTAPALLWGIKDQIREFSPIFGNTYLDDRLKNAFDYINNNYPEKTVTVATFYAGNYLPVYTNTLSFIGHSGYTDNLSAKDSETTKFFKAEMTPEKAKSFIMNNKITLVFQGPEEKILNKNLLYPEVLKPVYDKDEATIYELR